jgi:hypothetical protein
MPKDKDTRKGGTIKFTRRTYTIKNPPVRLRVSKGKRLLPSDARVREVLGQCKPDTAPPKAAETVDELLVECKLKVTAVWNKSVEGIIAVGKVLIEERSRLKRYRGAWTRLVGSDTEKGMLPFQYTMAYRLIDIAQCKWILAHVPSLPPSVGTLALLAKYDDATLNKGLKQGLITPNMERWHADQMLRQLHYKLIDETPRPVGQPREVNLRNVETLHRNPDEPITPVMVAARAAHLGDERAGPCGQSDREGRSATCCLA